MGQPTLQVQKRDAVTWLILNRPESLNALNEELVLALAQAADDASSDTNVRAVVLSGSGGNFCSGLDLKSALPAALTRAEALDTLSRFQAVIKAITASPKPFIACLQGAAVGFGADLALACDFRIFGQSAYLQEKFIDIGLMPDGGGTYWLPQLVGLGRALEILLLAERVVAPMAEVLGLATRVVADDQVPDAGRMLAEQLCAKPPLAVGAIKAATRASAEATLTAALDRERQGQSKLLTSADFREGVSAWVERRQPKFIGS